MTTTGPHAGAHASVSVRVTTYHPAADPSASAMPPTSAASTPYSSSVAAATCPRVAPSTFNSTDVVRPRPAPGGERADQDGDAGGDGDARRRADRRRQLAEQHGDLADDVP